MKTIILLISVILCLLVFFSYNFITNTSSQSPTPAVPSNSKNFIASEEITKREADLKKPEQFEDVRGRIENGVYLNECFGFTMNLKQKGFSSELHNQEGYKYNFEHPTAVADDNVLSVFTDNFTYTLYFYQSHAESHTETTAADILAQILNQYQPSITKKILGNKKTAYAQTRQNDKKTDHYAMLVNGFFIRWQVNYGTDNAEDQKTLDNIVKSIQFDWMD